LCDFGFARTLADLPPQRKKHQRLSDMSKSFDFSNNAVNNKNNLNKTFTEKFKSPKAKRKLLHALSYED